MITEIPPIPTSTPAGRPELSAGGWFVYDWVTDEFGVDMLPPASIGDKLGQAIIGGLTQYDRACLTSDTPRTLGDIDALYEDGCREQMRGLATGNSGLLYKAIDQSRNLYIDPDIRRDLDRILQDLVDFTHTVASESAGVSRQFNSPQPYSRAA